MTTESGSRRVMAGQIAQSTSPDRTRSFFLLMVMLVCASSALPSSFGDEVPGPVQPETVTLGRPVDFDLDVYPFLDAKCMACHNKAVQENDLILEDVAAILKGGASGPAVVAGEPDKSLLYQLGARVNEPVMPPLPNKVSSSPLTPREAGLLRQWILEGAKPGSGRVEAEIAWQPIPSQLKAVYGVGLSSDGHFAACSRANQLDIYDVMSATHVGRLVDPALASLELNGRPFYPRGAAHRDLVHSLAYSPASHLVATGSYREVKLWSPVAGRQLMRMALPAGSGPVAISPDGVWAAATVEGNAIQLWNVNANTAGPLLSGHQAAVTAVCFLQNGQQLLTAADDKSIRLWSTVDGQLVGQLAVPSAVNCLLISKDDSRFASGHDDDLVRTWGLPFGPLPAAIDGQPVPDSVPTATYQAAGAAPVTSLAWVEPAGNEFLVGGTDGQVRHFAIDNPNPLRTLNHGGPITGVACRADGQQFATIGASWAKFWKATGEQQAEMRYDFEQELKINKVADAEQAVKMQMTRAEGKLFLANQALTERTESLAKSKEQIPVAEKALADATEKKKGADQAQATAEQELAAKTDDEALKKKVADAIAAVTMAAAEMKKGMDLVDSANRGLIQSEKGLASATENQQLAKAEVERLTAAKGQAEQLTVAERGLQFTNDKPMLALAYTADGRSLATAGEKQLVQLWNTTTGKGTAKFADQGAAIRALFLRGTRLFAIGQDRSLVITESGGNWELVRRIGPGANDPVGFRGSLLGGRVVSVAFSPDGKWLATGGGEPSRSGELMVWNVETGERVHNFPNAHSDTVNAIAFSADGAYLATGAADKFVKVHELATERQTKSFEGHTNHVLGVTWRGDGGLIASSGADNAIKIWNVDTGEQARTINNYGKQVTSIQFIGLSDNIASCSGDRTIKLHRAGDGGNYRGIGGIPDYLYSLAISRDEAILLTGCEDGVLRLYDGRNGQLLHQFAPPPEPVDQQAAR